MAGVESEISVDPIQGGRFFNRELSWLEFNWRVLHEAQNGRTPLMERMKFLAIVSNNLDEFFMKRVGGLKRQVGAGVRQLSVDGKTPKEQLSVIRQVCLKMVIQQRECLLDDLLPELRKQGVFLLDYSELGTADREHLRRYYEESIFPVLTPLAVDPGHPFPFLSNLTLSLAVRLREQKGGEPYFARVKVPDNVPRWVPLPGENRWAMVEQVISHNLDHLFPNSEILEVQPLRVTRNADIKRDEEEADDLLDMIEEELRHRRFAPVVRLEVAHSMSEEMIQWLRSSLELTEDDIYTVRGPLRLCDLMQLGPVDKPSLYFPSLGSSTHPMLRHLDGPVSEERPHEPDFFQVLKEKDILVHHPFQAFSTSVLRFLEAAVDDPHVLAIKQTLYRTAKNSPIIAALIKAAANGKQVAVLVEIKARFDEANNIEWVRVLENAGVHVSYGIVGLKTHTKTLLVVREEQQHIQCYCHIGTGNYHTGTARLYTDVGLLTCREEITRDIVHLFNSLTGRSRFQEYEKLLVAPVNMRAGFLELIRKEQRNAEQGKKARIIAKMNSLEDLEIIQALYDASSAGVEVDLSVRGFCCLRPGVPGLSENIRVVSTIGRFLEHSRIYYFYNAGDEKFFIGSADWMYRNLDRRVECITPVEEKMLHGRLMRILMAYLKDKQQTWDLFADGSYRQRKPETPEEEVGVQAWLVAEGQPR